MKVQLGKLFETRRLVISGKAVWLTSSVVSTTLLILNSEFHEHELRFNLALSKNLKSNRSYGLKGEIKTFENNSVNATLRKKTLIYPGVSEVQLLVIFFHGGKIF